MGVLISFSGIDGAGKSTQIKLLAAYLKARGKRVYSTEEMFGYFLLAPLVRLGRAISGSPSTGPVKRNKSFLGQLWFMPAFFDIWLGYNFKVRPRLAKYDFVLADRFYTDLWANLLYYGYLPIWAFGLIKLLPKADRVLLLSLKPEIGRARADEFPLGYFYEQARIYRELADHIDFSTIDANRSAKEVFEEVKEILNA